MKRFPSAYLLIVLFCCSTNLGAAPSSQGSTDEPPVSVMEKAAAIEMKQLIQQAEENKVVNVIIELNEDITPSDYAKLQQKHGKQTGKIKLQEKALMDDLPEIHDKHFKSYEFLPFLAMPVTKDELIKLHNSKRVLTIFKDGFYRKNASLTKISTDLGADKGWASGYTGKGQSIVVIDSGVARNHPFLQRKVVREACFSSRIEDKPTGFQIVTPICRGGRTGIVGKGAANVDCRVGDVDCAHGTFVAILAAGNSRAANFQGSGMAPEAKIIAIKAESDVNDDASCDPDPAPCRRFVTSDLIKSLDYVLKVHRRLHVAAVNMSLGGPGNCFRSPLRRAIRLLRKDKVATVISSGNDGTPYTISEPACIPEAISVGSTNSDSHVISEFSNGARSLDLLAPGEGISVPNFRVDPTQEIALDGTSFSAPVVAGAWATLKQHRPKAKVDKLLEILKNTGTPIVDVRNATIKPEINIERAHNALGP
ncbi:serine protease AprX [biofilm metagenome]